LECSVWHDTAAGPGMIFLPWTTLMYLLVAPGGISGFDAPWLALAALVDVASYAGGGIFQRRRRAPSR
jgi:hypothetical protein